jgi:tetratricopeptide (TPR) repeat protein
MVPHDAGKPGQGPWQGLIERTEGIMDGMDEAGPAAPLAESVVVWRALYTAWNVGMSEAEHMLFRLICVNGSQSPQAMDLLARIYFQQGRYDDARKLWNRASELQPGNPALRRTALSMNGIAESPSSAVLSYRVGMLIRNALLLCLLCIIAWVGIQRADSLAGRLMERPDPAASDIAGQFHYEYESITRDMRYELAEDAPGTPRSASGWRSRSLAFTRERISNGEILGRVDVTVERMGPAIRASGEMPSLYVRYLVEQSLWDIEGVTYADLRGLTVSRIYRVSEGDSLWLIARRVYGRGALWELIARANNLSTPYRLRIGQELSLPLGDEALIPSDSEPD